VKEYYLIRQFYVRQRRHDFKYDYIESVKIPKSNLDRNLFSDASRGRSDSFQVAGTTRKRSRKFRDTFRYPYGVKVGTPDAKINFIAI